MELVVGELDSFRERPIEEFSESVARIRGLRPDHRVVLIVDEVQELIKAIADTEKTGTGPDGRILNAWQGELESNNLIFILTGSLRLSRVQKYLRHSLFRRVHRIPIGFLSGDATREALLAPVKADGVIYSEEAVERVWALTHGYASIVQRIGLGCLERLNQNGRHIVVPDDVIQTAEMLLRDAELFSWWWDPEILVTKEEALMRKFVRIQESKASRGVEAGELKSELKEFSSEVNVLVNNLCDQEILEFAEGRFCVKGRLLEEWLGRKFKGDEAFDNDVLRYCALVVDHENFFINMQETFRRRTGQSRIDEGSLEKAIRRLIAHVNQYGNLVLPVAVAVWKKGEFRSHRYVYEAVDGRFETPQPASFRPQASDDEARRSIIEKIESVTLADNTNGAAKAQGTVILVSGDSGFKEIVDRLKKQGRRVVVWAWDCSLDRTHVLERAATKFETLDSFLDVEMALQQRA
jgi:hypothetical protein